MSEWVPTQWWRNDRFVGPIKFRCPTCKSAPGEPCRTRTTARATNIHAKRWELNDLPTVSVREKQP